MATELGQAYVQIMPSAKGISGSIQKIIDPEARAAGQSAGNSLGSSLAKAVTGIIATAGIGKAFSSALMEGANLQQSLGGIETLFKGSANKVKNYANKAYRTTGMSANSYMENVTSFSASLLSSLGGNTEKAADVANMAMVDMSDNANKMGTSMDRITDAYQGFAKQNYTMLDNLKLGYGGTKTEMERLLKDAEKLTGVKYDINNLSDVYQAIHAIQENLDITGTTVEEAASTFSGSFASMKAAAQNVLGKLALGEDIKPSLQALASTTSTFLFGNFIPMVGNIIKGGIATIFGDDIANAISKQAGIVSGVLTTFYNMTFGSLSKKDNINLLVKLGMDSATAQKVVDISGRIGSAITSFYDMVFGSLSKKDNVDFMVAMGLSPEVANQIVNIAENIRVTFENIGVTIGNITEIVGSFIGDLLGIAGSESSVNLLGTAFESLTGFLRDASEKLKDFTGWLKDNPAALDAVKSAVVGLTAAWTGYKVVTGALKAIEAVRNATLAITNGLMLAQFVRTGALTAAEAANAAATMGASGAFGIFNAVLSANPIGLIITAIAALTAGLIWFFTQTKTGRQIWSVFVDWIKQAWQGIADFFVNLWSGISEGAKNLWTGVVEVWNGTVEAIKEMWNGIVEFFSNLWTGIQTVATTAWTLITTAVMTVVQPFIDGFMNIWNGMKDGLTQMWEGIKMIFTGAWEFIKSIFLGAILIILDLVTGNFTQLGTDLGLIWEGIKNGLSLAWEGIKTYFSGVVDAIVGYGKAVFENFSNALIAIWEFIKSAASSAWEWIKTTVSNLIDGLVQTAQNTWDNFVSFLSNLWENIKSTASAAWEGLKAAVLGIIDGLISGAQRAWDSMVQGVSNLITSVTNLFNGLANIDLFAAGKAILDGFLNGLKSAWDTVTDFVGGIAGWIRDHKGPIEYDRKLLIPAGGAIMASLDEGLQDGFKDVKSTVGGMAGELSDTFSGEEFDVTATSPLLSKEVNATVSMSASQMDQMGQDVVSEIATLRSSLDDWLDKLLNKESDVYLDGEPIAQNVYRRQGRIMAREGI